MRRIVVFLFIISLLALAIWQGYRYLYRAPKDLSSTSAVATLSSKELIQAFETDSVKANRSYLGKVVTVEGTIRSIEKEEGFTIVLGDQGSMSAVRCSMDTSHLQDYEGLQKGTQIKVKGHCTGFTTDELLGSDVILNRCVINH